MMRGIFERPSGSGVWWAHYHADGKRHRVKVGRKSDALKLYQTRKAAASLNMRLPEMRKPGKTTVSSLIEMVLDFTVHHKDRSGYVSKAKIVGKAIGHREAALVTPAEIEQWLGSQCRTPATYNRYKAFLSLAYRLGIRASKVASNPARDALHRKEPDGRERYLLHEEYTRLRAVIAEKYPEHLAEYVVSVNTGMRLGEQYRVLWPWYSPERLVIRLPGSVTKNKKPRDVSLNEDAVAAIESLRAASHKATGRMFPREVKTTKKLLKESFDNR